MGSSQPKSRPHALSWLVLQKMSSPLYVFMQLEKEKEGVVEHKGVAGEGEGGEG